MGMTVVVIPVADVDRAKEFYGSLGWRLDADFAADDDFRTATAGCSRRSRPGCPGASTPPRRRSRR